MRLPLVLSMAIGLIALPSMALQIPTRTRAVKASAVVIPAMMTVHGGIARRFAFRVVISRRLARAGTGTRAALPGTSRHLTGAERASGSGLEISGNG